jgi:hypothetical protein
VDFGELLVSGDIFVTAKGPFAAPEGIKCGFLPKSHHLRWWTPQRGAPATESDCRFRHLPADYKNSFLGGRKNRDFDKVMEWLKTLGGIGVGGAKTAKNKNVVKRTMRYRLFWELWENGGMVDVNEQVTAGERLGARGPRGKLTAEKQSKLIRKS